MPPAPCRRTVGIALFAVWAALLPGSHEAAKVEAASLTSSGTTAAAYEAFRRHFGRARMGAVDRVDYATRLALFQRRRAEVEAHNALPHKSWVATVNKFSDYTEEELRALMGYRRPSGWQPASQAAADVAEAGVGTQESQSFLEVQPKQHSTILATTVDWRSKHLDSAGSSFLREQGGCGSCWAVAAAGALETHAELGGLRPVPLSYEQLVDCTPNPKHCGGDGGCKGATGELAFEFAQRKGVVPASAYRGYQTGGDGKCSLDANRRVGLTIAGWRRLPENRLRPLLETIYAKGPAVVSVDATNWGSYASGVFNGCQRNATVNHAVLLVGYGEDSGLGKKYWTIRNSWGSGWGEGGYMRLERQDDDRGEKGWCGTDFDPKQGVGCDGGPKTIEVCGMCGILSDSSYPFGVRKMRGSHGPAAGPQGLGDGEAKALLERV